MDIEGCELDIFDTMTQETALKIEQISAEVHCPKGEQDLFIEKLKNLGFELAARDPGEIYVTRNN